MRAAYWAAAQTRSPAAPASQTGTQRTATAGAPRLLTGAAAPDPASKRRRSAPAYWGCRPRPCLDPRRSWISEDQQQQRGRRLMLDSPSYTPTPAASKLDKRRSAAAARPPPHVGLAKFHANVSSSGQDTARKTIDKKVPIGPAGGCAPLAPGGGVGSLFLAARLVRGMECSLAPKTFAPSPPLRGPPPPRAPACAPPCAGLVVLQPALAH